MKLANLTSEVANVNFVVKLNKWVSYEFTTYKGISQYEDDEFTYDTFRLFIYPDGKMEVCEANTENFDVLKDYSHRFNLEAIKKICESADVEDVTDTYIESYQKRKRMGEDVDEHLPEELTVPAEVSLVEAPPTLSMGEKYDLIDWLANELEDAVGFMSLFEDRDEEAKERYERKVLLVQTARYALVELQTEYKKVIDERDDDNSYRICDECGVVMTDGYGIDDGSAHYCTNPCRDKHMTQEEYDELYGDGNNQTHYTDWQIQTSLVIRAQEYYEKQKPE